MSGNSERLYQLFFEVFEPLPRQGPGNKESAVKALSMCSELGSAPEILDLGCGAGGQTIYLAELTSGNITAIDSHAPNIERLKKRTADLKLQHRITPIIGDMARSGLTPESFDLVWSEGALYNLGIETALPICLDLLRNGGYLVFTDAVWALDNPPEKVIKHFDYPSMGKVSDIIRLVDNSGFSLIGHFKLPDEAWWDDFYSPMERRIEELKKQYAGDDESIAALEQIAEEPKLHREYSDYYNYEFFVLQKTE